MANAATTGTDAKTVHSYKLVVIGDSDVGKTCILLRLLKRIFYADVQCTVGASFCTHTVPISNTLSIKFNIWDSAGQERYRSLAPMYYRGADAAILVYDITRRDSFESAKIWLRELEVNSESVRVVALAGNKLDLVIDESAARAVSYREAEAFAQSKKMLFYETSAKSGFNVDEVMFAIANKMPVATARPSSAVTLRSTEATKTSGCCRKG